MRHNEQTTLAISHVDHLLCLIHVTHNCGLLNDKQQ